MPPSPITCSWAGAEDTATGVLKESAAVWAEVWKIYWEVAPGTTEPFCWREAPTLWGNVVPLVGEKLPWKATAYTPGMLTVNVLLPGVWLMSEP